MPDANLTQCSGPRAAAMVGQTGRRPGGRRLRPHRGGVPGPLGITLVPVATTVPQEKQALRAESRT